MEKEKIRVGKIVRGFGIKGEVKLKILTDFPEERFKVKQVLYLLEDTDFRALKIETVRYHQNHALLKFADHPDLSSVEAFAGKDLYIDRSKIDAEETVHTFQLMGMEVYDESERYIGQISDVMETPAHMVLRIKTEGKDVLVPYVDAFVIKVNEEENKLIIRWMEGL